MNRHASQIILKFFSLIIDGKFFIQTHYIWIFNHDISFMFIFILFFMINLKERVSKRKILFSK